jgi:hypothetical protein
MAFRANYYRIYNILQARMPLNCVADNAAKRCRATAKSSRERCKNPAAFGCSTCRLHGARRPKTIKRGADHPAFQHGKETLQAKAERSSKLEELRQLEGEMHAAGILVGPRWRGRKPVS